MKKVGSILLTVAVVLAVKFGYSYFATDVVVEMSKHQAWPAEFKAEYVRSCAEAAQVQFEQSLVTNAGATQEVAKINGGFLANSYCNCITDIIEGEKIIPTKYNKYKGESQYASKVEKIVVDYLGTQKGKDNVVACSKQAGEKLVALVNKSKTAKAPDRDISSVE